MDISTLVPSLGGGQNVSVRTEAQVSAARASAVIDAPAVEIAVSVDDMTVESRLESLQNMGIYLKQVSSKGIPKWAVMTALRAYGLNLEDPDFSRPAPKKVDVQPVSERVTVADQAPVSEPSSDAMIEPVVRPLVQPSTIVTIDEPAPEPRNVVEA